MTYKTNSRGSGLVIAVAIIAVIIIGALIVLQMHQNPAPPSQSEAPKTTSVEPEQTLDVVVESQTTLTAARSDLETNFSANADSALATVRGIRAQVERIQANVTAEASTELESLSYTLQEAEQQIEMGSETALVTLNEAINMLAASADMVEEQQTESVNTSVQASSSIDYSTTSTEAPDPEADATASQ